MPNPPRLHFEGVRGFVFDLDGVITDTARVHASAWKDLFDGYLARRAERTATAWTPFDADTDYFAECTRGPRTA